MSGNCWWTELHFTSRQPGSPPVPGSIKPGLQSGGSYEKHTFLCGDITLVQSTLLTDTDFTTQQRHEHDASNLDSNLLEW